MTHCFRLRRTDDIGLIRELDAKLFGTDVAPPKETHLWWLLYADGEVAGYCGLGIFTESGEAMGFLSRSGVLRGYRGQGLQRRMIRVREAEAKRQGVSRLVTYTSRDNMPSANNLISCGYKLYLPQQAWGVRGGLYFDKSLL
jgi:GNAT superfamily N-acetyltransferase